MTTISVPIPAHMEESLNNLVKSGYGANKADVVRRAITRLTEEEAVHAVLRAEQEIAEGKGLKGDLKELIKKIK
jgi:Arc/MetJ-type ribon-helix-helix transcriptional regulator